MLKIKRLESGYWHIKGDGPCNLAQPPHWPCDEATLREHAFPEACEAFIRECMAEAAGFGRGTLDESSDDGD